MKVAIVTGASSGIGFETAKMLAKKDYRVYALARNTKKMQGLSAYNVKIMKLDITDYDAIKEVVELPQIQELMEKQNLVASYSNSEEFAETIKNAVERNTAIMEDLGLIK